VTRPVQLALAGSAAAVLLDMDGTLVRSEHVHRRAWKAFFAHWGVEVADVEYERTYMGRRVSDVLTQVPGPWSGVDSSGVLEEMTGYALAAVDSVQMVPGAAELLARLHDDGTPTAVVTSAGTRWADAVLDDVLQLRHVVDVVVSADRVRVGKPSPEGYLLACELLEVRPDTCLAFEDSPSGVAALVAAGVERVVGVTTTSEPARLRDAGAAWTVDDLTPRTIRETLLLEPLSAVVPTNDDAGHR
jgi:sugar-phosphatase